MVFQVKVYFYFGGMFYVCILVEFVLVEIYNGVSIVLLLVGVIFVIFCLIIVVVGIVDVVFCILGIECKGVVISVFCIGCEVYLFVDFVFDVFFQDNVNDIGSIVRIVFGRWVGDNFNVFYVGGWNFVQQVFFVVVGQ